MSANPYSYTEIAEKSFVGRDYEINTLESNISRGSSIAVVGGSRIGKTSLIERFIRNIPDYDRSSNSRTIYINIDMSSIDIIDLDKFYNKLLRSIYSKLETSFNISPSNLEGYLGFLEYIGYLARSIKILGVRILVIIDGTEKILLSDEGIKILRSLRSIIQGELTRRFVIFSFVGDVRLYRAKGDISSPIANILEWLEMRPMNTDDLIKLINLSGIISTREDANLMIYNSGGNPHIIQYFLKNIKEKGENISSDLINILRGDLIEKDSDIFTQTYSALNDLEKNLLNKVISSNSVELSDLITIYRQNTRRTLEILSTSCLVKRNGNRIEASNLSFNQWYGENISP